MYRLLVIMLSGVLIAGCGSLQNSDFLSRTGDALSKIGQKNAAVNPDQEIQPLFDQPYIDPLTEYLQRYANDPTRAAQIDRVRQERERRCADVAQRYNQDEITETALALYRRGYSFSCPQDVAAFEARLKMLQQASASPKQPANESLSDCYLLTQIRNFSGALQACRGPAEAGAVGAQVRMAQIQNALGNHEEAYRWARKAVPESAEAANLLGELYAQGLGVALDKNAAAKWFRTAAELGHSGAEHSLDNLISASAGANAD